MALSAQVPPGAPGPRPAQASKDILPDPTLDTSIVLFPGAIIWQTALAQPPAFAPAFDADRAYALLLDDTLVALSVVAGSIDWTVTETGSMPPAAGQGVVAGVLGQEVWVREASSGKTRWRRELGQTVARVPLIGDEGVVVTTEAGEILCLRLADGEPVWRRPLDTLPTAVELGPKARLFAGTADGRVTALSMRDGTPVWTRNLRGRILVLTAIDDRLYAGSDDNFLYVLKSDNGGQEWKWRTGGDVAGFALADKKRLYYASLDSVLRAHSRGNGHLTWYRVLPSRPLTGPVALVDRVVVADVSADLRGYEIRDGSPAGIFPVTDRILHAPHVAAEVPGTIPARFIMLTGAGHFMAVGRGIDGAILRMWEIPGGVEILPERPIDWVVDPALVRLVPILAKILPPRDLFPLDPQYNDLPLEPLAAVPGRLLPAEVLLPSDIRYSDPPLVPLGFIPGTLLAPEELPVPRVTGN